MDIAGNWIFIFLIIFFRGTTLSRKDNSMLTPRYWFPILFFLSVVLKYKLLVPVSIFFSLKTARFLRAINWYW
jgi:hypothetical protein